MKTKHTCYLSATPKQRIGCRSRFVNKPTFPEDHVPLRCPKGQASAGPVEWERRVEEAVPARAVSSSSSTAFHRRFISSRNVQLSSLRFQLSLSGHRSSLVDRPAMPQSASTIVATVCQERGTVAPLNTRRIVSVLAVPRRSRESAWSRIHCAISRSLGRPP